MSIQKFFDFLNNFKLNPSSHFKFNGWIICIKNKSNKNVPNWKIFNFTMGQFHVFILYIFYWNWKQLNS